MSVDCLQLLVAYPSVSRTSSSSGLDGSEATSFFVLFGVVRAHEPYGYSVFGRS